MKSTDNIQELKSIDAHLLLKDIAMPFAIPSGYFEHLSNDLLQSARIANNIDASIEDVSLNISQQKQLLYDIPSDYFQSFPQQVIDAVRKEELIETAIPKLEMPFELSNKEAYFQQFGENLKNTIASENDINLSKLGNQSPFIIEDANYFDNFAANIIDEVKQNNSELGVGVAKNMPYELQEGYFVQFETQILSKVKALTTSNTLPLATSKRKLSFRKIAVSVAAVLTIIVGARFANTLLLTTPKHDAQYVNSLIAGISQESINDYIEMNLEDFEITQLSASISNYTIDDDPKIRSIINSISQEELNNYLETIEL